MKIKPVIYDLIYCLNASKKINNIENRAHQLINDPDKKERLEKQECKVCFYYPTVGCDSMSHTKCAICEKDIHSSNTNIDILCTECAKELRVCKHCGADMQGKQRRKL